MSWWKFWQWGKGREKQDGQTRPGGIILGGSGGNKFVVIPKVLEKPPTQGLGTTGGMATQGESYAVSGDGANSSSSTSSSAVEGSGNEEVDYWFNLASDQFFAGNLQGAIASYDKAIEIKHDDHEAWYNRGVVLGKLGRYEDAIASYDKALEIKPDKHGAWNNRGFALGNLGRYEEAIASYDKALEIKPDYHDAWNNRGFVLDNLGRYEEAIASYDKAIEIKHDDHEAWINRGAALGNLGRYEDALTKFCEAIASYDKAIEIKPDYHEAWINRGAALGDLGRYEEAIASYDKALEIKPDYHRAWYNRGIALGNLGRNEEAIASFDKALEIKPDRHEAWYNRGVALRQLGRYEEAIASYDKAIEIKPDFHDAWYNRGVALDNLGRYEEALTKLCEAIASFDKAIEIKPDNHNAWYNRGVTVGNLRDDYRTRLGRPLSDFLQSRGIQQNPDINRAGYVGNIANYNQGLEICQKDTHPEGWGCLHWWMGRAHYLHGKNQEAPLRFFREARKEYVLALQTLTASDFPETHLKVLQDYLKVYRALEPANIEKVLEICRQGSELLNKLITQNPSRKERLQRQFIGFGQITVDLLLQSGEVVQALEEVEKSKAVCLDWMLPPREPLTWAQMQNQMLDPAGAFIYWYYSPLELHTILLLPHQPPHIETTPVDALDNFLTTWNEQYSAYTTKDKTKETQDETWRQELPNHLTKLTEILSIEKVLAIVQEHNIQNLTLIPHRDLHRLPLHALGFPDQIKIRYLPTLHLNPHPSPLPERERGQEERRLLSVEAPDSIDEKGISLGNLSYAALESAYICQSIGEPLHLIANAAATKDAVNQALHQGCQIFHFSGHAGYDFQEPVKSALCLSQEDRLNIADILQIPLDGCQLVCLSACETGITSKDGITTEYVGLVSAFLAQGVGCIVSTLWQVKSESSAIIMIEFYRRRQTPNDPKDNLTALHETLYWIHTATVYDLKIWATILQVENLDRDLFRFLKAQIINWDEREETDKPYSDPYHWAAFTITGG